MVLLETTDGGKDIEVKALAPLVGIGCRGFAIKAEDIADILTLGDGGIRPYLEHLSCRLLPPK